MAEYFATWFYEGWGWLGYLLAAVIQAALLVNVIALGAVVFIWLERKVSGRIQDRLGPTRTGGRFGWLQSIADGIKLLSKEDLMPAEADALLFRLAPYVAFAAGFSAFMALPFSDGWVALQLNTGIFFLLAVLGMEVFGVILAGYSSGSKWSLFGAMRQAAQVVSYEVPLGMCAVIPVMICGTMDLVSIGNQQAGFFTNWLIFHNPFTFIVFWVYFTCALASVNRAPFDLAEAESELVAGFLTEYSGIRWSLFFMAEYGSMFLVSGLAAILFFGGWNGPIPVFDMITGATGISSDTGVLGIVARLAGVVNFIGKASLGVAVMMWVRWTFPRLRVDQVITMCLQYCVPLAAFCFIGVLLWTSSNALIGFPLPTGGDLAPVQVQLDDQFVSGRENVREGWFKEMDYLASTAASNLSPKVHSEDENNPSSDNSLNNKDNSDKSQDAKDSEPAKQTSPEESETVRTHPNLQQKVVSPKSLVNVSNDSLSVSLITEAQGDQKTEELEVQP